MIRDYLTEKVGKVCLSTAFRIKWNGDERGDYSTNLGSKEKAEKAKKALSDSESISKIETEKGFVNFWLSDDALEKMVTYTCDRGYLADWAENKNRKIQVEFISANPTGPLTLGNGRGGVYGDVLANVLKEAGFDVTKEYYINDAGKQIEILSHPEEGQYEYIKEIPKQKDYAEYFLKNIKKTVSEMGIEFDVWFSETEELRNTGKVDEIMEWLKEKKMAYEKDGALWFRASRFGDIEDRVLIKENGEPTYFGVDCAYHKNKFVERKFDKVINVWGADHHGDVARVKGFVEALGFKDKLEIILMQHVRLVKDGKPVRMSKREGNFILIDDVLKEVGKDAFRYFMLTRSANTHMDFDMDLAKEQSKKNPVYYVQYAGARMSSILEKAVFSPNPKFFDSQSFGLAQALPTLLMSKNFDSAQNYERRLILKIIQLPEVLEDIVKDYQVHKLATYVYELAKTFTDFYENIRVLDVEDEELKNARLSLVAATRQILERVFKLMGTSAPEKM